MAKKREFLLVDGYNIIFSWDELKKLSEDTLESARIKLFEILSDYQGITGQEIYVVFDGHLRKGNTGSVLKYDRLKIVYTKEDETADSYIEKKVYELPKSAKIRVATSDNLEQILILGEGATRISAREFFLEVRKAREKARESYIASQPAKKNLLLDNIDPGTAEILEHMRRQKGD